MEVEATTNLHDDPASTTIHILLGSLNFEARKKLRNDWPSNYSHIFEYLSHVWTV